MFRGRILIVSDDEQVIAELDPLIRAEGHLSLTVPSAEEALQVLDDGIIPDIVVTEPSTREGGDGIHYLSHFRQLNQLGKVLAIARSNQPGAAAGRVDAAPRQVEIFDTLAYPFAGDRVRTSIEQAMDHIRRDLESLRAEMFRETARLQRAIREAQLELVTALAMMMEAKDPFMQGHCARVGALARRVAERMGIEEEQVELLETAAQLHEIGKVSVSLDLLHQARRLTPEELEQVRGHTRIGAQFVGAVPSLRKLAPLVATQYTDYQELPAAIPADSPDHLLACILKVVDSYDAMTSPRSYRRVLSRDGWESALREGVGTQYHPGAVDALFQVIDRDAESTG
jgi:response regulator RpfG family c-di-GMP phosphodiesterase